MKYEIGWGVLWKVPGFVLAVLFHLALIPFIIYGTIEAILKGKEKINPKQSEVKK